jgi:hypothetical protein
MNYKYYFKVPSGVNASSKNWSEWNEHKAQVIRWCNDQGFTKWGTSGDMFWFTSESEYALFLLRWADHERT